MRQTHVPTAPPIELKTADPNVAVIVTVHHPPFSGDTEHPGSTAVYKVLFDPVRSLALADIRRLGKQQKIKGKRVKEAGEQHTPPG
jgi:hypothetical protein